MFPEEQLEDGKQKKTDQREKSCTSTKVESHPMDREEDVQRERRVKHKG